MDEGSILCEMADQISVVCLEFLSESVYSPYRGFRLCRPRFSYHYIGEIDPNPRNYFLVVSMSLVQNSLH
jgi:hypothetical protein